ncbi:MAG: DUF1707 domain-containing protein [Gemmatimonadales bacterium]
MDPLESDRQQAIRALSAALVSDRLPVEQFESRLTLIRQAPNRATLEAILADLVPSGEYNSPLEIVPAARDHTRTSQVAAPVEPAEVLRIGTILSSSKRTGSWTVPYRLEVKILLGDLTIDLRDAVFGSDLLEIHLDCLLGNLELIVPAGAQVENECDERWSSTSHSTRSARGAEPIGLLIRLAGQVRWSNVEIKEKRRKGDEAPSFWKRLFAGEP